MTYPRVPLKHLCVGIGRGSTPRYAEGLGADAMVVGQSCQRPGGWFDPDRARAHEGPIPTKGRLCGAEILVNSTGLGTLGRVCALRGLPGDLPWFADTHLTVVRVDPRKADPRFLGFALAHPIFQRYAEEVLAVGATKQRELSLELLRRHRIPAPPLATQAEIADRLEHERARVTELDRRLAQTATALTAHAQSAITERLAETAAVRRPLAWAVDPQRPILYGIVLPGEPVDNGVLLVKGGNVERGELSPQSLVRVHRDIEARFARARLRGGDLLVTIRGSFGAVAQVPPAIEGANITQDTARVAPAAHVDGRYLLHALRSLPVQQDMASRIRGSGVKGLNIYDVKRLKLPIPERNAQTQLARELDVWWDRRDVGTSIISNLRKRLAEYFDAIVFEATTGALPPGAFSSAHLQDRMDEALDGISAAPALT